MTKFAKKPLLVLGAAAVLALSVTSVSYAARGAAAAATAPSGQRGPGEARGPGRPNPTALASALGVTVSQLEAAIQAVRAEGSAQSPDEFARNLSIELGLAQSKVTAVLESVPPARPTRAARQTTALVS